MQLVPRSLTAALIVSTSSILAGTGQDVVFRTSVDLVTVDATVLGRDGKPTTDLTADDFALKVDGQPRRIVSAQFVSQQAPIGRAPALYARHFSSNENADAGRFVVVAVDEAHIRRTEGRAALSAAGGFIDRLDPLDRVAVVALGRAGVVKFTRDRAELKQQLEKFTGQTDPVFIQFNLGLTEAIAIADGGRVQLADVVLRECGQPLSNYTSPARAADEAVAGGRDACPEQLEQEARAISQHTRSQARISMSALESLVDGLKNLEGPKTVVLLSEGMVLDPRLIDLSNLAALAKEARVAIYVLQMETPMFEASQTRQSPTFLRDIQLRADGLERVAGATRGAVFRLVGSDPQPFDRIATELSGYYLLAFEATDKDRDGRLHRLDVQLTRGRGLIRARSTFRMAAVVPTARTREQELVDLLRGTRVATELPIRIATYTYADSEARMRVVVSTEADAAQGPASQVLMGYVLTNSAGVIAASGAQLAGAGRQAFSTVVAPGKYTLRVAGIDPLDRRGLVERPFVAALETYGGVRLSDLILAHVPPKPNLPLQPLVDRVTDPRVTANLEIYGAEDVQVTFAIDGVAFVPAEIVRGADGMAIARAVLALRALSPGSYIVRADVMSRGKELARVTRPFTYAP